MNCSDKFPAKPSAISTLPNFACHETLVASPVNQKPKSSTPCFGNQILAWRVALVVQVMACDNAPFERRSCHPHGPIAVSANDHSSTPSLPTSKRGSRGNPPVSKSTLNSPIFHEPDPTQRNCTEETAVVKGVTPCSEIADQVPPSRLTCNWPLPVTDTSVINRDIGRIDLNIGLVKFPVPETAPSLHKLFSICQPESLGSEWNPSSTRPFM